MYTITEGLSYDDVLLIPQFSKVKSRSNVNVGVSLGKLKFDYPIIPANMKTIMNEQMISTILSKNGLAIMHRFTYMEEQLSIASQFCNNEHGQSHCGFSVGVKKEDRKAVISFFERGARIICLDVAHGDSEHCLDMIKFIKDIYSNMFIIAGNVATYDGAIRLWSAGADVVKAGISQGSICSTAVQSGHGVPSLTTIMDISKARETMSQGNSKRSFSFIADGGIKNSGDIVKSLCFADMIMAGNLFSGCEEAPGEIIKIDGNFYKEYSGSSTHRQAHIEGVEAMVPIKGSFNSILESLLEGVKSGCSYQGVFDLKSLKENPRFIKISSSGLRDSHPHDVLLRKK